MCPETGKGDYGVVLASCDAAKQEDTAGALTKAFKFDAKVANAILKSAPIIVFEGLSEAAGKLILEKMKGLSDAGCELKLTQAPFETTKKLTWPKPHAFVLQAQKDAAKTPAEPDAVTVTCPKCGEHFTFDSSAPSKPAAPPPTPPPSSLGEELLEEIPASEALPETGKASDDIMELDEFEAALEEIDIESPPSNTDDDEDLGVLAGVQAVESETVNEEKAPPADPKETPAELKKTMRYTKPKAAAPAADAGGADGPAVYRVILSKMRSDKTRNDAAEVIAQIRGISQEEALKAAGKLIVTAAKDVTEAKANEIKNTFTSKGIKAIVSKRK